MAAMDDLPNDDASKQQPPKVRPGRIAGRPPTWTQQARAEFLEELGILGSASAAAAAAGIAVSVARYHRDTDPEFAAEWAAALDRVDRTLMRQVRKMALEGIVTKTVRDDHGNIQYEERKYSERLLLAYLRRMESGTWTERVAVEQSGTVQHEHSGRIEVEKLTPEQRSRVRDLLESLKPNSN